MKIIKNEKLIERNSKIGNYVSLGALVILGGGMYISFSKPQWFAYSIICLVVGYLMTQVGMYMGNRWGRSPRPVPPEATTGRSGRPSICSHSSDGIRYSLSAHPARFYPADRAIGAPIHHIEGAGTRISEKKRGRIS